MSADSYHHMVEKATKDMGNVFDFDDWLEALNRNGQAIVLEAEDCQLIKKGLSSGKHTNVPYIEKIQELKFESNSSTI